MSFRDNVEAILMGDGDITEMTNALMTELNRARRGAWDEGAEAGSANQGAWDGWRYSKGYPLANPYEVAK